MYCLDTLETSLFAPQLFPTADGPGNTYPAPHLTLVAGSSFAGKAGSHIAAF
jgi:enterochelin esterase-like enzyme